MFLVELLISMVFCRWIGTIPCRGRTIILLRAVGNRRSQGSPIIALPLHRDLPWWVLQTTDTRYRSPAQNEDRKGAELLLKYPVSSPIQGQLESDDLFGPGSRGHLILDTWFAIFGSAGGIRLTAVEASSSATGVAVSDGTANCSNRFAEPLNAAINDERCSDGGQRLRAFREPVGHIRASRTRIAIQGHGFHVVALRRSCPFPSCRKEARIKLRAPESGSSFCVLFCEFRRCCHCPHGLPNSCKKYG